jgi:hypothetical protein
MSSNLLRLDPFAAAIARKEREELEKAKASTQSQPVESSQPTESSQPRNSSQPEKPAPASQKSSQPVESSQPLADLHPPASEPPESRQPIESSQPRNSSQPRKVSIDLMAGLPEVKGHAEIPYQIIDHLYRHLPPPQQAIYTQLYRLSWGWGSERCFISNPSLAARSCLSLSAVKDNVNKMVAKGLVQKTGNTLGFGKDQGIEYIVRAPSWQSARSSQLRDSRQSGKSSQPRGGPIKEDLKEIIKRDDVVACPDCNGTGFWYPGGNDKGVAKCQHRRLGRREED